MITFTTEQEALDAKNQIWINFIRDKASQGDGLVGLLNDPYTTKQVEALSDDKAKDLVIYGYKNGKELVITEGFTTAWADYGKAFEQELCYMQKPDVKFMTGVTGHTEQDFNSDWLDPSTGIK